MIGILVRHPLPLGVTVLLLLAGGSGAQRFDLEWLLRQPAVGAALTAARKAEPTTLDDQVRFCEVPAPPFQESKRAHLFADALRRAGMHNVRFDAEGNVLGERPGRSPRPHVVLAAHLDTVFPDGTDVRVSRDGNQLRGPGIGDNCRGLAVLVAIGRALGAGSVVTNGPITFVGTVGEEGLGDLRGARALMHATLKGRVDVFVGVDGAGHAVFTVGTGSRRYRVTFTGPGGHSADDFGAANPVHALGRAVSALAAIEVPRTPRTTFNVGRVGGGTAVNAIPTEAWMELDLRSSDEGSLRALEARVERLLRTAAADETRRAGGRGAIEVRMTVVGDRPAGRTAPSTPLVQAAVASARVLSLPVSLVEGSTDANIAMSLGIPAVTVGAGGRGSGAHTLRESFDAADSWRGTQRVLLLAAALAGVI